MKHTTARPFHKARSVNSSSANFPSWVTTELDPSFADVGTAAGRTLEKLVDGGNGAVVRAMIVFPYGLGSDNDVFDMRLVGYRRILPAMTDGRIQFLRFIIAKLTATISGAVGLAASGGVSPPVLNTERFADTITIGIEGTWTADTTRAGSIELYSPANDSPAHAIIPLVGVEAIEWEWDQTTGTPTMNALVSYLDAPSTQP